MGEMTIDQQTAVVEADAVAGSLGGGPDAVVSALLGIVDDELAAGPERRHVLSAALEVALLGPEPQWLEETRDEVLAEHASTVAALKRFPVQRGEADSRASLVQAADVLRDRRLEVLDVAAGLVASVA